MKKLREQFAHYDAADYLNTEEDIAAYLTECASYEDPALFLAALGDVARARNMSDLAKKTCIDPLNSCTGIMM